MHARGVCLAEASCDENFRAFCRIGNSVHALMFHVDPLCHPCHQTIPAHRTMFRGAHGCDLDAIFILTACGRSLGLPRATENQRAPR
jgi:hypothetical protein